MSAYEVYALIYCLCGVIVSALWFRRNMLYRRALASVGLRPPLSIFGRVAMLVDSALTIVLWPLVLIRIVFWRLSPAQS